MLHNNLPAFSNYFGLLFFRALARWLNVNSITKKQTYHHGENEPMIIHPNVEDMTKC